MIESPPTVPTVGAIARREGVPTHRIEYIIRSRGMQPAGRAGSAYIYSEADFQKIAGELRRIQREREEDGCE